MDNRTKFLVNLFIKDIVNDLGISKDCFKIGLVEEVGTKTGRCSNSNNSGYKYEVTINVHSDRSIQDICRSIAHELRHVWQHESGVHVNVNKAIRKLCCPYNIMELDARRYAEVMVHEGEHKLYNNMYYTKVEELRFHMVVATSAAKVALDLAV